MTKGKGESVSNIILIERSVTVGQVTSKPRSDLKLAVFCRENHYGMGQLHRSETSDDTCAVHRLTPSIRRSPLCSWTLVGDNDVLGSKYTALEPKK